MQHPVAAAIFAQTENRAGAVVAVFGTVAVEPGIAAFDQSGVSIELVAAGHRRIIEHGEIGAVAIEPEDGGTVRCATLERATIELAVSADHDAGGGQTSRPGCSGKAIDHVVAGTVLVQFVNRARIRTAAVARRSIQHAVAAFAQPLIRVDPVSRVEAEAVQQSVVGSVIARFENRAELVRAALERRAVEITIGRRQKPRTGLAAVTPTHRKTP